MSAQQNQNLYCALRNAFPQNLDEIAVQTTDALNYSWRDLDRASAMVANLFEKLQIMPGERIVVHADKSVETMIVYLAALRGGHIFVPLNPAYQKAELEYFIEDANPALVVCSPANEDWIDAVLRLSNLPSAPHWPLLLTLGSDRTGSLLGQAALCSDKHTPAKCKASDVASIIYTSGTTGRSKGAMLTHGNLLQNALVLKQFWGWRSPDQGGDVLLHALPIFHVHGLFVAIHGALLNGSKMIWCSHFDPALVLSLMGQASIFMGVPTMYVRMLAHPKLDADATRNMRLFISGSAPLLKDTFETWQQKTGHTILERYGMSETIMLTSNPYYSDQGQRRGGTVGLPLPGVQVRICNEDDHACAGDEIGNILVHGPSVFCGYWQMPQQSQEAFTKDGFFRTGDVGFIDSLGYLTLVGRSKDLIISGGLNIYPAEIEAYINELPGVAESAVIAIPHADFGEVGVAFVVATQGSEINETMILEQLKQKLAHFKVPKRCLMAEDLPRNTMGKVLKAQLRESCKYLFGAH